MDRISFLKNLIGLAAVPAISAQIEPKPVPVKVEEVNWRDSPSVADVSWTEKSDRWRVGDVGQTDLGYPFFVLKVDGRTIMDAKSVFDIYNQTNMLITSSVYTITARPIINGYFWFNQLGNSQKQYSGSEKG